MKVHLAISFVFVCLFSASGYSQDSIRVPHYSGEYIYEYKEPCGVFSFKTYQKILILKVDSTFWMEEIAPGGNGVRKVVWGGKWTCDGKSILLQDKLKNGEQIEQRFKIQKSGWSQVLKIKGKKYIRYINNKCIRWF
jgi:hypothetical protein